jgi:hypothetical protein
MGFVERVLRVWRPLRKGEVRCISFADEFCRGNGPKSYGVKYDRDDGGKHEL